MKINSTLITIVLTLLLCGCVYWALSERNARKQSETALDLAVKGRLITDAKAPVAFKHVDTSGISHTVFNTTPLSNKQPVAVSKGLLDTITKDLNNVKPGDVVSYQLISARAEAQNLKAKVDSLEKQLTFFYKDAYLNLSYRAANPADPNDKGVFGFGYNIQLKSVSYTKGLKLLGVPIGTQQVLTDISSKDKRTTIDGLEYITIKQPASKFNVNLQAAGNYSFVNRQFQFGPAIQINTGRVQLSGTAYYNNDPQPFSGKFTSKFNPELNFRVNAF